jgi:four helix bundle protein
MTVVTGACRLTKAFSREEEYGLTSQLRRSAVSIPANIAEGYGRKSTQDYLRFLNIATGSLFELQTLLEIGHTLEYIPDSSFKKHFEMTREVERMLSSLIKKVSGKG